MALALPLIRKEHIIAAASIILNSATTKNERIFGNEVMGLAACLPEQISVINLEDMHALNNFFQVESQYMHLKKCKTPQELFGNTQNN